MKLKEIMKQLPEGYKEACWETKAMMRKRGIQDEEKLLILCLYYAYDHSLVEVQNYAKKFLSVDIRTCVHNRSKASLRNDFSANCVKNS